MAEEKRRDYAVFGRIMRIMQIMQIRQIFSWNPPPLPTSTESEMNELKGRREQATNALRLAQDRLAGYERRLKEYEILEEALKPLPQELSRPVMVPFGSLAFFPGRLIHTNELTVCLGENWFVDRTVPQTLEILSRRKEVIRGNVKKIQSESDVLNKQLDIIGKLQGDEAGDMVEIVEHYDDKNTLISSNLPQYEQVPQAGKAPADQKKQKGKQTKKEPGIDFDQLLQRIEDLEKLEAEEEAVNSQTQPPSHSSKKVQQEQQVQKPTQPAPQPQPNTQKQPQPSKGQSSAQKAEPYPIRTPADIYHHLLELSTPKSDPVPELVAEPVAEPVPFKERIQETTSEVREGSSSPEEGEAGQKKRQVSFKEQKNVKVFKAGSTPSTVGTKRSKPKDDLDSPRSILKSPLASPSDPMASSAPSDTVTAPVREVPTLANPISAKPSRDSPEKTKKKGNPIRPMGVQSKVTESFGVPAASPSVQAPPPHVPEFDDSFVSDDNIVDLDEVASEYHQKREKYFSPAPVPVEESRSAKPEEEPKKVSRFKAARMQAQQR